MDLQDKKVMILAVAGLALAGMLLIYVGLRHGGDIAMLLFNPIGAPVKVTTGDQRMAVVYGISLLGGSLLVTSEVLLVLLLARLYIFKGRDA